MSTSEEEVKAFIEAQNESFTAKPWPELDDAHTELIQEALSTFLGELAPPLEIMALRTALSNESDRGCGLLAASYLEVQLEQLLRAGLIEGPVPVIDSLFEGTGPFSTFSARIDAAFCLGYLPAGTRRDLHLVRKIRNSFAHHAWGVHFENEQISNRCRELRHGPLGSDVFDERRGFVHAVLGVAAVIHAATVLAKRPVAPADPDYEKMQEQADLLRQALEEALQSDLVKKADME